MDEHAERLYGAGIGRAERRTYAGGANMRKHAIEQSSPEQELMKAVLATCIKDYLNGIGISEHTKKGKEVTGRAKTALRWIEDRGRSSTHYVFGFIHICKFIDIDPDRFRKKILGIRTREDLDKLKERYYKTDKKSYENQAYYNKP